MFILILLLGMTSFDSALFGQWKRVLCSGERYAYAYTYFLDLSGPPRIGFTGADGRILKTTDGGETWKVVTSPIGIAYDFTFKDSMTGWCAFEGQSSGCYKTSDGGESWFDTPLNGVDPGSIYYDSTSDGLFYGGGATIGGASGYSLAVSWDKGLTWVPAQSGSGSNHGFAFVNGDTGIQAGGYCDRPDNIPWLRTTDGGHSWQTLSLDSGSLQPLAIPGTSIFFALTFYGTVLRSTDAGMTWDSLSALPYVAPDPLPYCYMSSSGCIKGDLNDLYGTTGEGCYHSTDKGQTWQYQCGQSSTNKLVSGSRFYAKAHIVFMKSVDVITDSAILWKLNLDSMPYFDSKITCTFADSSKLKTVAAGHSATVYYFVQGASLIGIDTVHLSIRYDDALNVQSLQLPPGSSVLRSSTNNNILDLWLTSDARLLPSQLLAITFGTALESSSAKVYLDSAHLYGKRLNCDCAALSVSGPDSVEIDFTGCGNTTLLRTMSGQSPFEIVSVQPNPAQSEITVRVAGASEMAGDLAAPGTLSVEMYDVLGRAVNPGQNMRATSARDSFTLDVAGLPPGLYYLRMLSNGYAQTRSISIER
ncbi:MAG: T9SS type A sorting domain-containing protein [Bacteroidota bacterium]|nr:T9SS type A sorting domain-containing protein [Bacteroidota bacterium]MDP4234239.1 T9SS type A sorting domain-containing protein [Bacteroidota bacterium]MDP4243429.1 T9SS type A sorting domain-containing protein [Bacteroidota bacterium]MDP4288128.1 T9SS type A sorting domain-containing protein [Bacteroidota bacterium]